MRPYTMEDAERDAHVIDLIDARARFARTLALRESMAAGPAWAAMMDAAGAALRDASRACRDCQDRIDEIDGLTSAAEAALR